MALSHLVVASQKMVKTGMVLISPPYTGSVKWILHKYLSPLCVVKGVIWPVFFP